LLNIKKGKEGLIFSCPAQHLPSAVTRQKEKRNETAPLQAAGYPVDRFIKRTALLLAGSILGLDGASTGSMRLRCLFLSYLGLFSCVILTLFASPSAQTALALDVLLVWNASREPDVTGYRVFLRGEGTDYDYDRPVWEGADTRCTVCDLDDETNNCFVVRAFDASGYESVNSREACLEDATSGTLGPCAGSAEASTQAADQTHESPGLLKDAAYLLLPLGTALLLSLWRRKKRASGIHVSTRWTTSGSGPTVW
jgi:hypothetical protein